MNPLHKVLNYDSKVDYCIQHVALVNCLAGRVLTDTQIEVLGIFIALGGINTENRKILMEEYGYTTSNISNHLRDLKEARVVVKQQGKFLIQKAFYPSPQTQSWNITINEVRPTEDTTGN